MLSLAVKSRSWPNTPMAVLKDHEAADRRRKGLALKALRRRLGVTQEDAAAAFGVTTQAWQNYEGGKRHFSDPKLLKLLVALNSDREEFDAQLALIPEETPAPAPRRAVEERGFGEAFQLPVGGVAHGGALRPNIYDEGEPEVIDFARFFAPGTRVLRLGGMSMFPYAEPGGFVTYNPRHPARRGQGAVIEMKDGSYAVKRFERFDAEEVVVTELFPEEREIRYALGEVAGVYAIGLRGD